MRRHLPWLRLTAACLIGLAVCAEAGELLPGEFIVRTYLKNTLWTAHDTDHPDALDAVVTTATSIGPNERFKLTLTPPNDIMFQTAGGHYLSATGNIHPGNGDPRRALQTYTTFDLATAHFRLVNPYRQAGHTNIVWPWMGYFTIQTASPYFLTAVGGGGQSTAAFHTDALHTKEWEFFWVLKCGDLGSGYVYRFRPAGTGSPGQPKERWLFTRNLGEGRTTTHFGVFPSGYRLLRQDDGSYAFEYPLTRTKVTYLTAVGGGGIAHGDNLHADATWIKAWEKFRVVDRGDCTYTIQTVNNWFLGVNMQTGEASTRISDPDAAPSIGYAARFELVMRF
jgi:hypothetical protein